MNIRLWMQASIYVSCVLGSLLIAFRDQGYCAFLLALGGVVAFFLTDKTGWVQLPRNVGNFLALVATVLIAFDFVRGDTDSRLLAISKLLAYVQLSVMFQRKTPRQNWQLLTLGLLTVVIGATLETSLAIGGAVLAYAIASIAALSLLYIDREISHLTKDPDFRAPRPASWLRWLTRKTTRDYAPSVRTVVHREEAERTMTPLITVSSLANLSIAAFVMTAVYASTAPRVEDSHRFGQGGVALTGFEQGMELGRVGRVLQDTRPVMRIAFQDMTSDQPPNVGATPYVTGIGLSKYVINGNSIAWRPSTIRMRSRGIAHRPLTEVRPEGTEDPYLRQFVTLAAVSDPTIFHCGPAFGVQGSPDNVYFDPFNRHMYRRYYDVHGGIYPFSYVIGTAAFVANWQKPINPLDLPQQTLFEQLTSIEFLRELLEFDPRDFPNIQRIADEIIEEKGLRGGTTQAQAAALVDHFTGARLYTYSLDLSTPRDPGMNAIEDFVAVSRTGHCEYFASALTLMLRSQGIPARVMVGFRAGRFNRMGGFWQVRNSDAHAWVEAYVPPSEISRADRVGSEDPEYLESDEIQFTAERSYRAGGWMRLEPTPVSAAAAETRTTLGAVSEFVDEAIGYTDQVWRDYVMQMQPVQQLFGAVNTQQERSRARPADFSSSSAPADLSIVMRSRLTIVIFALGLSALGAFSFPGVRRRLRRLVASFRRSTHNGRASEPIRAPFYEQLLSLFAKRGLKKPPGLTPQEFVSRSVSTLVSRGLSSELGAHATAIVKFYYALRFGRRALDNAEQETIEKSLRELSTAIKKTKK